MRAQLRPQSSPVAHDSGFCDLVRRALDNQPCFVGQNLLVEFDRYDVVLRGEVQSWYHKQVAQETVLRVAGVGKIHNELTVAPRRTLRKATFPY